METGDEQIESVAHALDAALRHACALVDAETFGPSLRQAVQKARRLHEMLEARVNPDENWVTDKLSLVNHDAEDLLERLEALAQERCPPEI